MSAARVLPVRWLAHAAAGAALGGLALLTTRLGLFEPLAAGYDATFAAANRLIGPVWIPMAMVGLRVAWVAGRALRTRSGHGPLGVPVRHELGQLAPLFAALGLCGTVWGLMTAFEALESGEFLTQLPRLLGGLGTAMTSTLVGLGLQVATLLLGVVNPAWSWARVGWDGRSARYALDGRPLGADAGALGLLVRALEARRPEALCLAFEPGVPAAVRREVADLLWQSLDGQIRLREVHA